MVKKNGRSEGDETIEKERAIQMWCQKSDEQLDRQKHVSEDENNHLATRIANKRKIHLFSLLNIGLCLSNCIGSVIWRKPGGIKEIIKAITEMNNIINK